MDDELKSRLSSLDEKLKMKAEANKPMPSRNHMSKFHGTSLAYKMVADLLAGVFFGLALGYGIDYALGTKPIFLIIMLLLGVASGFKLMIETAKAAEKKEK